MPTSANPLETGPQPLRLMLDRDGEHAQARLRLLAAFLALGGATWLSIVDGRVWPRIAALLSAGLAVRLVQSYRAARAALASASGHYIEITADQVVVAEGDASRSLTRAAIVSVELDHDRLVVVLRCADGSELAIEPRYGGLTFEALGEALQTALAPQRRGDALA